MIWEKNNVFLSLFCASEELCSSALLIILHKGNQCSFQYSSSEPYILEAIWNWLVALSSSHSPSSTQGRALAVFVNQCGTEQGKCGQPQSQDAFPCYLSEGGILLLCDFFFAIVQHIKQSLNIEAELLC